MHEVRERIREAEPKDAPQGTAEKGPRIFDAAELRTPIDSPDVHLRAMIHLGLNCAYEQTNVAALPQTALDLETGWVDFPRPKTGIPRRYKLWAETVKARRESLVKCPKPKASADANLVFVTRYGNA